MNAYNFAASTCLGMAVAALAMAELGVSSLFGNWHPTHQTAIAFGVVSIAISSLAHAQSKH